MSNPAKVHNRIYIIGGTDISHPFDCNIYLLDLDELVLIDSGAGESFERIIENIIFLGYKPEDITTVIATHGHIDHIGSLFQFQDRYNARIIAHQQDANAIEYGHNTAADMYALDYIPCKVDIKLTEEQTDLQFGSYQLHILHIPGHTPGSIAAYTDINNNRVLFGQDIHGPYFKKWGADPKQAKQSLQKLLDLEADILCEGHFGIFKPAQTVAGYIKEYRDSLLTF